MIHPALFALLRMRIGGLLKRFGASLKTWQGLVFLALTVGVILLWMAPLFLLPVAGTMINMDTARVREFVPIGLMGACLLTIILGDDKALRFTPAEVDFLFPAPFTRQQLMAYKLLENTLGAALAASFFFVWVVPYVPLSLAAFWGSFQALLFIQLFQAAFVLAGMTISVRLQTVTRWWIFGAVGLIVLVLATQSVIILLHASSMTQAWMEFRISPVGQVVFAPFELYGLVMVAESYLSLLVWGFLALAINVGLVLLILKLDKYYLEAALASSQRFLLLLSRLRKGGALSLWGSPLRWRLPLPPRWGGAGPIAWRQLTHACRSVPTLLSVAAVVLFVVSAPRLFLSSIGDTVAEGVSLAITAAVVQLTLVFTMMLRFDFRNDLEQIDWLKIMPVHPIALVLGELIVPVLIATITQAILLLGVAYLTSAPGLQAGLIVLTVFTLPLNFLLFGLENFLFLMFPSRSMAFNPGDLQGFGRQTVLFLVKMLLMVAAAVSATILGALILTFTGSLMAAMTAAWLWLAGLAVGTVPLVAWAFQEYDPSTNQPV